MRVLQAGEESTGWLGDHPTYGAAADAARDRIRQGTKTRLPCWSPVRCHPASTRGVPAVEHVTCLVLDYDDGTAMDPTVAPWTDWPLLVAKTWSHTREAPRRHPQRNKRALLSIVTHRPPREDHEPLHGLPRPDRDP